MRRLIVSGCILAVAVGIAIAGATPTEGSSAGRPLHTAFVDPTFSGSEKALALKEARTAGTTFVRLILRWAEVAPNGVKRPAGFNAADPGDPRYRWKGFDDQIRSALAARLIPFVDITGPAPPWAQRGKPVRASDGSVRPSPSALGDFATAAARRYGGGFKGMPRVRYWQVWNEPNLSIELMPQYVGGEQVSGDWYRGMVNAVARGVHGVHGDNVVIAGGLAPFGGDINDPSGGIVPNQERIHPLEFMRRMLCMSKGSRPRPTCKERSEFDVWGHHPYTYGGPTHKAFHADDVSLGDLGKMRSLLNAASRARHINSRGKLRFWVTEFSYDSQPGDPKGLDPALHTRWVSEALYRMWQNGVSLVTWFLIRDEPFPDSPFQSGLFYRGSNGIGSDRPKPALRAFRFPFVAFRKSGGISYWGRTPPGVGKAVVVEQRFGTSWRRVALPAVDFYGIFSGRIGNTGGKGPLRARVTVGGEVSVSFSLAVPKDFRFCPWGSFC